MWVANQVGNSVTEINAGSGALIRVLSGKRYHFHGPTGIAADGHAVWVTNQGSDSITRLGLP